MPARRGFGTAFAIVFTVFWCMACLLMAYMFFTSGNNSTMSLVPVLLLFCGFSFCIQYIRKQRREQEAARMLSGQIVSSIPPPAPVPPPTLTYDNSGPPAYPQALHASETDRLDYPPDDLPPSYEEAIKIK